MIGEEFCPQAPVKKVSMVKNNVEFSTKKALLLIAGRDRRRARGKERRKNSTRGRWKGRGR